MILSASDLVDHFRQQRKWTRRVVAAIPPEDFEWAPAEDAFSCGDLVRHLLQSERFWRKMILAGASGESIDPFGLEGEPEERMAAFRRQNLAVSQRRSWGESPQECLDSWHQIEVETAAAFSALTSTELTQEAEHPLLCLRTPVWRMILLMVEHEGHHRGQLSAYLKMIGAPQPAAWY